MLRRRFAQFPTASTQARRFITTPSIIEPPRWALCTVVSSAAAAPLQLLVEVGRNSRG
jgi:hypothetical protein